ncbi:MAG: hypothetical protein L7F78_13745, partial [Syntrophales bacterium LBB04]|nr:hypothetical protein [Syntrophales bacterium LBB04]
MEAILAGTLPTDHYLDGEGLLAQMEQTVRNMMADESFRRLFFDPAKIKSFKALVEKMRYFLSHEERMIEENAGLFSTSKVETLNSRIIMLRDITWSAEQDILLNFDKIARLAGAGDEKGFSADSLKKYKKLNFL